jgi:hypothetical protein
MLGQLSSLFYTLLLAAAEGMRVSAILFVFFFTQMNATERYLVPNLPIDLIVQRKGF